MQRLALWDSLDSDDDWIFDLRDLRPGFAKPLRVVQCPDSLLLSFLFSLPILSFVFLSLFHFFFSLVSVVSSVNLLLNTLHGRSTRLLDLGHLHLSKFSPDGSGGSARRTRHARRQGMGPTCLFRRSQPGCGTASCLCCGNRLLALSRF